MGPLRSLVGCSLILAMAALFVASTVDGGVAQDAPRVDYNRDVRPILAANCYTCHGPDPQERKAGLRLDEKDAALAALKESRHAIVPGDTRSSLLLTRISATDADDLMPPPESGKRLTTTQIETLRQWIDQGAEWTEHWAYVPPIRPELPAVSDGTWPRAAPDHFILSRLDSEGLSPSPESDRITLARRLSFDLLGLPPRPEQIEAFVGSESDDAYERLIDELLRSPHYGERMAIFWLDLTRFADTRGYHSDNPRNVAPYRDYVIRSFNDNVPFDQFTIEQLAGDLLPDATLQHRIASCYNKLLQTTQEGGAQPKEYEAIYAADRVRNVSTVWMGATLGCAQCHDHKFDPYAAKDFYTMAAFFADIEEKPIRDGDRGILLPTPPEKTKLEEFESRLADAEEAFEKQATALDGNLASAESEWAKSLAADIADGGPERDDVPKQFRRIVVVAPAERTDEQRAALTKYFRRRATPLLAAEREALDTAEKERNAFESTIVRCLISVPGEPRVVRILPRGNWLDESGEIVQPAIPKYFGALDTGDRRATRLDLARWFLSQDNSLTARVFVNRLWKLFFGTGLSSRLDDLGAMGEPPVHPELLDWLAVEFRESGWNVKHMVKLLLLSATYRQSSLSNAELRERDPYNRLLARQSRWRLDAEMVRDNALAISGLLSPKIGGPSVKPYQPEGYWLHLNFPKRKWVHDEGESGYRRGLYTWWQRSFPHPSMTAFDAPSREECTAERPRSNIPQQALVLLNDPTYVEAARVFAFRAMTEGGGTPRERLRWAFRRAVSREPQASELSVLAALYKKHRASYVDDPAAAKDLVAVGLASVPDDIDVAKLAAWTSVARTLLNLHETVTRN